MYNFVLKDSSDACEEYCLKWSSQEAHIWLFCPDSAEQTGN